MAKRKGDKRDKTVLARRQAQWDSMSEDYKRKTKRLAPTRSRERYIC
jgi:hypothetical protein